MSPRPTPCFVVGEVSDAELARYEAVEVNRDWALFVWGKLNWVVQTRQLLRARGWECHLSRAPLRGAINFRFATTLLKREDAACFTVGILADKPQLEFPSNLVIVQNRSQEDNRQGRHFIPHWPQPGLIPRDDRRAGVNTVASVGSVRNMGLAPLEFAAMSRKLGLSPRLLGLNQGADFSAVDVLVGVRSFDRKAYETKPASKLINAWLAGIPFIGGYDSAFSQAGNPGQDYLQVSRLTELESALARLRDEPSLVSQLVKNGRKRAVAYTQDAIASAWIEFIEQVAGPALEQWESVKPGTVQ